MGALEYEPDLETRNLNKTTPIIVSDLVELAESVLQEREILDISPSDNGIDSLISVGTSAGGAKAKAIIAVNDETKQVLSGQSYVPKGYEHWIFKEVEDAVKKWHEFAENSGLLENQTYYIKDTHRLFLN